MGISLKTHKILWGRSGGKCAICKRDLVIDATDSGDDPSVVGDEAHIIARMESFTRGDHESVPPEQRDHYSNLILLCKVDHKIIDDCPTEYTVERLREIKANHEEEIKAHWTPADKQKQHDDEIYASYIDEWVRRNDLDNWQTLSSHATSSYSPALPKQWYESAKDLIPWIIARIWPNRYPILENALFNYKAVLQDFLLEFDKHIDWDRKDKHLLRTERFYKIREWDPELYRTLLEEYNAHECLVCDLFFELTRAANYVCDRVREYIFPGFRLKEGALLILRHSVGYELKTIHARLEYRGGERTDTPYPGLKEFKKVRYTRDYALDPNPPSLPTPEEEDA